MIRNNRNNRNNRNRSTGYINRKKAKTIAFFTSTVFLLFLVLVAPSYDLNQDPLRASSDYSSPSLGMSIPTADAQTSTNPKYVYGPSLQLTGANEYQEVNSSSSLQPTRFSVGAWFNTASGYSSNSYIANKGGDGSETRGKNMNFGIWMTSAEQIQGGFETTGGTNYYATSTKAYNDGIWHYAVVTYDGKYVRLYVDGVQVASKRASNKTPDNTGTQPLRIGANSLTLNGYFTGNVDEIRVWNGRALTSSEVANAYNNGAFNTNGQVAYLSFSNLETTPPTITSKSPDAGATGVTIDTNVVIIFSEDMLSSSVNTKTIQLKKVSTNTLLSTTVNEATGRVTMDPTSNLEYATEYEARVDGGSSGVKDLAGNPIPREVIWRFTTLAAAPDTTPPTVSSTNPASGSTGVGITSASISATFNEAVNSSSVNTNTFIVKDTNTNTNTAGTVTTTPDGKISTFTPSQNLSYSHTYTATITTGVKDLAGNPMTADYSWTFSTQDAPPPPDSDVDPFGIKKLFPTKTGGEVWYMDMQNPTGDPRFEPHPSTMTRNPDGSWKISGTQIRLHVFTSTGYDKNKISTYDQQQLASKGYMQASNDWKNVEMTGYVKLNSFDAAEETLKFQWYNRGGKHLSERPCEGTGYKGGIYFDGRQRTAKEQWHVSYVFPSFGQQIGSVQGKWLGFKYIVYNIEQSGKMVPKMEQWVDTSNDGNQDGPWTKIYEYVDTGGLGSEGTACNGAPDQLITWGGPDATFRWDNSANTDFKYLSVREIQPP